MARSNGYNTERVLFGPRLSDLPRGVRRALTGLFARCPCVWTLFGLQICSFLCMHPLSNNMLRFSKLRLSRCMDSSMANGVDGEYAESLGNRGDCFFVERAMYHFDQWHTKSDGYGIK